MEQIYARRQPSDYFTTSPDQYNLFGKFGSFSPRYSIKNKYPDRPPAYNVEFLGRLEPNNVTKPPSYTISCRHETSGDPDGLVGPTYTPPPMGTHGPRYSIGRKLQDDAPSTSRPIMKPRTNTDYSRSSITASTPVHLPSLKDMKLPKVDRGEGPWPDFSKVTPRFQVREPESGPGTARSFGMSTRIVNTHDEVRCGPVGRPEYRKLPELSPGLRWTIKGKENADFVR
jgi:hypothetical protein